MVARDVSFKVASHVVCWCKMRERTVAENCGLLVQNVRKNFGCELWSVGVNCEVARDICFAKSSLQLRTMWSVGLKCEVARDVCFAKSRPRLQTTCGVLVQNGRKNCGCELSIVGAKCVVAREKCFAKSSVRLRTTWSVGAKCEEEFWM